MNKMKQLGIKPAWLLAAGAIFALSVTILNSCSSDEDYDMYMGDELRTHAAATRSAAPEPGSSGGTSTGDGSGYWTDVDNCGGVVLAQLHALNVRDGCVTYSLAYAHVKQLAGSCFNMTPEKIIEVASGLDNVNLSAFYTAGENSDSAAYYLELLDNVRNKVIIYRMEAASSEHTGLHAAIGSQLFASKADKSKWSVWVYASKDGTSRITVPIGKIMYIIY